MQIIPPLAALPARAGPGPEGAGHRVPALLVVGVSVMAGAFGLDVLAHGAGIESLEPVAHEAGMLGMLITWGAVVVDGLRKAAHRV